MASWKIDEAAPLMESQVDLGSDFSSLHDERLTLHTSSYNSMTSSPDDINNISGSVDDDECMSSIKTIILANNIVEVFAADKLVSQDKSLPKDSVAVNPDITSDREALYLDLESYPDGADAEKLVSNSESYHSECEREDPERPVSNLEFYSAECDRADPERPVLNLEACSSESEEAVLERLDSDLESYHCECDSFFNVPSIVGEDLPLCHANATDTPSDTQDEPSSSALCSQHTDYSEVLIMPLPRTFPNLDCWTRMLQRENSMLVFNSDWKITYRSTIASIPDSGYATHHQAL